MCEELLNSVFTHL